MIVGSSDGWISHEMEPARAGFSLNPRVEALHMGLERGCVAPSSLSHLIEAEDQLERGGSHSLRRLLRLTLQRLHLPDEALLKRQFGLGHPCRFIAFNAIYYIS